MLKNKYLFKYFIIFFKFYKKMGIDRKIKRRNKVMIYSIVLINHGKIKNPICSKKTEKEIYKKFNELLKENKKVKFPMRFNNEKHVMIPSEHEIVIIKCTDEFDKKDNKIRDDNGEFITYTTDNNDWVVIDRAPYDIEETFWVYGYHPKMQRKTYDWVFENFILKDSKNKYMFKSIQIYHNKVLIECDGKLEMVICKNKSDSVRFYNTLETDVKRNKFKYIMFMGDIKNSKYKSEWIKKIMNLTNWNYKKVIRSSTRD